MYAAMPNFAFVRQQVERAAGPMTSVVSFAAQRTGVEGVLRRRLEARSQNGKPMGPPSAPASNNTSPNSKKNGTSTTSSLEAHAAAGAKVKKRRKAMKQGDENMEVDEVTSVADEEEDEPTLTHKHNELVEVKKSVAATENWQRRLMLSTAGAGVALSEESLKSLKYCLEWLRWANIHMDKVIVALRTVLDEWDQHNYLASPPTSPHGAQRGHERAEPADAAAAAEADRLPPRRGPPDVEEGGGGGQHLRRRSPSRECARRRQGVYHEPAPPLGARGLLAVRAELQGPDARAQRAPQRQRQRRRERRRVHAQAVERAHGLHAPELRRIAVEPRGRQQPEGTAAGEGGPGHAAPGLQHRRGDADQGGGVVRAVGPEEAVDKLVRRRRVGQERRGDEGFRQRHCPFGHGG